MKIRNMDSRKATMLAIIAVAVIVLLILSVKGISLYQKTLENEERLSQVEAELAEEEQRTDEITALQEEINSDEYIEKIAKEKLGMIKDNEILFKEKE